MRCALGTIVLFLLFCAIQLSVFFEAIAIHQLVDRLALAAVPLRFVTNTSRRTRATTVQRLRDMGYNVRRGRSGFGGYQAILRLPTGVYLGASESRKDGHAAGY